MASPNRGNWGCPRGDCSGKILARESLVDFHKREEAWIGIRSRRPLILFSIREEILGKSLNPLRTEKVTWPSGKRREREKRTRPPRQILSFERRETTGGPEFQHLIFFFLSLSQLSTVSVFHFLLYVSLSIIFFYSFSQILPP